MWGILAEYETGDSFGKEDTSCELPMYWDTRDKAVAALEVLKIHHKACLEVRGYGNHTTWDSFSGWKWFYEEYPSYGVGVTNNSGDREIIYVPYTGYFETLYSLRVIYVTKEDDGLYEV